MTAAGASGAAGTTGRKRVVILGGGVSGMTTALNLTDPRNPRHADYDVTVYQMGWRLGGKGASGRNMDPSLNYRIEEHGLHVWFGCYDNAFRLIQRCYEELNRPPDAPIARWTDAFKPHSAGGTLDFTTAHPRAWLEQFPPNDAVPGEGDLLPLAEYAREGFALMHELLRRSPHTTPSPTGDDAWRLPDAATVAGQARAIALEDRVFRTLVWIVSHVGALAFLLRLGERVALSLTGLFLRWRWARIKDRVATVAGTGDRHFWLFANAIYAVLNGFFVNRVFRNGLRSQNGIDFRDWLARYAIDDGGYMVNSDWMRGIYDGLFAYVDGDNRTPDGAPFPPKARCEAGVALLCGLRQYATYKGAAVWRMQAGMGDVVFGPMYEVLERRGVKFRLFHKVEALRSADGATLTAIDIARQVTITPEQESRGGYQPFVRVKGLPCWPATPLYAQLVEGETLKARGVNLEDQFPDWAPVERFQLVAGRDFDEAVLAISIGALPYICPELITVNPAWRDMVQHVLTTRTLSSQFWMRETASQLGWSLMQRPLISAFDQSALDTWADMSYLVDRENWHMAPPATLNQPAHAAGASSDGDTPGGYPLHVSYFCGPMRDDPPLATTPRGPVGDPETMNQRRANAKAREIARTLLEHQITTFFPNAVTRGPEPQFRWDLLVDARPGTHEGPARLDSQYFRANVQPSERYVLSPPGSDRYRLAPGASGFARLTLAGDWTDCGMNAGCVEGAVMSGMLASNALSAFPARRDIVGLNWW